jgi:hypothetical protein
MNFQWLSASGPYPIVEFHDVRTEKFKADRYLSLTASQLGGADLGQFQVSGHPDRLIELRGFAGIEARRRTLTAVHSGADWSSRRKEMADIVRSNEVVLTRAITPAAGTRPMRPGESYQVLISELRFAEQIGNYHLWLRLFLRKAGLDPIAAFATLESANDVPAVPVVRNRTQHIAIMRQDGRVPDLPPELRGMLRFPAELLALEPAMALVW